MLVHVVSSAGISDRTGKINVAGKAKRCAFDHNLLFPARCRNQLAREGSLFLADTQIGIQIDWRAQRFDGTGTVYGPIGTGDFEPCVIGTAILGGSIHTEHDCQKDNLQAYTLGSSAAKPINNTDSGFQECEQPPPWGK